MIGNKKILAVIPARAGSKRLKNKNTLDLAGKPLISWTIEAALNSKYIDKTVVSTDSLTIKEISEKSGVDVPFLRPKDLANDTAKSIDVVYHALDFFKKNGEKFEYIILLQPTSPLRTADDIDNAFEMMNNQIEAVVSVCEVEHSPLWSNTLPEGLSMKNFIKPEVKNLRSQDLPIYYRINGAIYIASVEYLKTNNGFLGNKTKALIMPQNKSVDIDNKIDLQLAELLINESN